MITSLIGHYSMKQMVSD